MALAAYKHNLGDVYRRLTLDNTGLPDIRPWLHMAFPHIDTVDNNPIIARYAAVHPPFAAPVVTAYYQYFIILTNKH
jgi:hypothetical protein